MARDHFLIAQVSDIHCGGPRHDEAMLDIVITEVNEAEPDLVLIPGDLTDKGYPEEFEEARAHLSRFRVRPLVIPGNHDARNVGYVVFEDVIGPRNFGREFDMPTGHGDKRRLKVVGCDSTRPDLDDGELGRHRQEYVTDEFRDRDDCFKILMIHHHVVPIPGTGRERNILLDAGDVLEVASQAGVDIIVGGHKHVPHVWPVAGMLAVTSGTASTWRTRGYTAPSFSWIRIYDDRIEVSIQNAATGEREIWAVPRGMPHPLRPVMTT